MNNDQQIYQSGKYLENNPDWHQSDSQWKAKHIASILKDNNLSPKTVAELGCGSGAILRALQKYFPSDVDLLGYDISPQAIELAKNHENNRIYFHCQDITHNLPGQQDVLLLIDVFEHVEDYFGLLRKIRKTAKYCVFHIPIDMYALAVLLNYQMVAREAYGHLHYFSKSTALKSLEDCGYEILDWRYTKPGWELPPEGKINATKARLLKYPRMLLFQISPELAARTLGGCSVLVLAKPK